MAGLMRTCIGCEQTDDHPRHVISLADGSEVNWHQDCHALATGCVACTATVGTAEGLKGDALREHIASGGAEAAVAAALADEQTED